MAPPVSTTQNMPLAVTHACPRCHHRVDVVGELITRCLKCGTETFDIELNDAARVLTTKKLDARRGGGLWRYREWIGPIEPPTADEGPLYDVGGTPLYHAARAKARTGLKNLWLKDDGRLPTGSLKDRASAVVVQHARGLGVKRIITASTGNAGVALAAMANAGGVSATVLVPESAPAGKIAQLMIFGADLVLVQGSYDDAFALSRAAAAELGWYCRNTGFNPWTVEGKKTVSFEIAEGLTRALGDSLDGPWRVPDRVYVSVGDGNIITGVHKGFRDLQWLGIIDKLPRIIGVQAEGSAAIANAFFSREDDVEPVRSRSLADSICADQPADGYRALRAVRATSGTYVVVSDKAILEAMVALGADASLFAEPAAAAAYAGLLQHVRDQSIDPDEHVVVILTGTGLKDIEAATQATGKPRVIAPNLDALQKVLVAKSTPADG